MKSSIFLIAYVCLISLFSGCRTIEYSIKSDGCQFKKAGTPLSGISNIAFIGINTLNISDESNKFITPYVECRVKSKLMSAFSSSPFFICDVTNEKNISKVKKRFDAICCINFYIDGNYTLFSSNSFFESYSIVAELNLYRVDRNGKLVSICKKYVGKTFTDFSDNIMLRYTFQKITIPVVAESILKLTDELLKELTWRDENEFFAYLVDDRVIPSEENILKYLGKKYDRDFLISLTGLGEYDFFHSLQKNTQEDKLKKFDPKDIHLITALAVSEIKKSSVYQRETLARLAWAERLYTLAIRLMIEDDFKKDYLRIFSITMERLTNLQNEVQVTALQTYKINKQKQKISIK